MSIITSLSTTTCIYTTFSSSYSPIVIFSTSSSSSSLCKTASLLLNTHQLRALKFGADGSDLLRKPVSRPPITPPRGILNDDETDDEDEEDDEPIDDNDNDNVVDWEDQILEDTVPLVGFVRMLIHSDRYESGERLSEEHEQTIRQKLLPFHPDCDNKIGCGIDYITVGYHPDFEGSRCLFIVRKDGELVDFSYWKCIKGLIKKNYPLYADSFILRHFRRHRQRE